MVGPRPLHLALRIDYTRITSTARGRSMSILVVCSSCSARLNAPDSAAGKKVKCPKCQAALVVPTPLPAEPAFEVVEEEPEKPAVRPKVKTDVFVEDDEDEAPRKKRRVEIDDDEDDDDDDRPRKKKRKEPAAGNAMMVRNIVGGVVLLVLLGVAGWVFYDKLGKKEETARGF